MKDVDQALADIAAIRQQVAMSTLFRGLGPAALAATGILALGAALVQLTIGTDSGADPFGYFALWIGTAGIALAILATEILRRRRKEPSSLADAVLQNALLQFLPSGMTGAALLIFSALYAPDSLWMLPGLWQILVALGIYAAARLLPGQTMIAAAWYFIAGFYVLLDASQGRVLSPWHMGVPFLIGQSIMAAVTWRATEALDGA
ncbi:MAG: hypothetical protein KDI98_02185 [Hyphomicrobiaceae bacterium]|nr:hypothetical protein [Hyphomicrobiaceae bacterium]